MTGLVPAPAQIRLPSPVSATAFSESGLLAIATEDGTLRLYQAPYTKVWKAIKDLGAEISSIVFPASAGEDASVWVACEQQVFCFDIKNSGMITAKKDALTELRLTEEEDDVINQIAINFSQLAYTLDSGAVGVLDLQNLEKRVMKTRHSNLCTSISFIPDRPREIVSAGYDYTLLHFDFPLGSLLSSFQISAPEPSSQVSLSPPFIQSLSLSANGLVACGLADGRIWFGSGGEKATTTDKNSSSRKKKRRKWEGLRSNDGNYFNVAEGPIVGIAFVTPDRLIALTLLGTLSLYEIKDGAISRKISTVESPGLAKANALAVSQTHTVVGGLDSEKKGLFLLWEYASLQENGDGEHKEIVDDISKLSVEV
ncbi:hypothetical protein M422DRAFT_229718 [Sphaerobolus stellatus SS14]|uniref:WD40 repeat-like protein n=1 Tax=Sphaerobolus stellatus (strain SS14) TaxID=990650 RepID=A0A0C9VT44_SPHS4|nr:hypothetical protein M422DRAFT_229718 [Sphaerobolus stellatus SS14]